MIEEPTGDPLTRLSGRSLGVMPRWRRGRRGISGDRIDALGRAHEIPVKCADGVEPVPSRSAGSRNRARGGHRHLQMGISGAPCASSLTSVSDP